ncbi:methyl-accepting chemotaxis protein [Leisingera aquaemixtae]|uniref:Methyl-accepting chemotaxis protein n=1 Tax=Leisingera aquaemixtae TaxID=1396826 RepID=A0ABY5WJZ3_9RHOB|nr:methyl-accepting chemotaxis protein [Leisingera aquaemixtae]UWQ41767.1 methyl-accepting chemotaxis protein [Leisingera aquaemixtae]
MKSKLTVSTAILSIIVLAGGLMAALVSLLLYSHAVRDDVQRRVAGIEEIYLNLDKIELEFLKARRAEKDFLLRRDQKYLSRHAETMTRMKETYGSLGRQMPAVAELSGTALQLKGIGAAVDAYEASFIALASSNTRLGLDENSGLEGQLRTAVKNAEATLQKLDQPVMQVKMLMMRRHEKDFIMRQAPKYLDRLNARVEEFRAFPASYYTSAAQQKEILGLIGTYQASFAAYVEESLNEQQLRKQVSGHYADAEPLLAAVHEDVRTLLDQVWTRGETVSAEAQTNALRAGTGGSLLFVAVALLLARSIARPLKQTDTVLKKMMQNDFTPEIPKSGIREIAAIAQAAGAFRKAEAAKQQLTREITEVIAACGEGDFSRRIADTGDGGQDGSLGRGVNAIGDVAGKGLGDVLKVLDALAEGDLTQRMPAGQKGVFKEIAGAIDNLAGSLEDVVGQLAGSGRMLNDTSQEIAAAVADASQRGESSAAALEQTAAALQTIRDTVHDTAASAQDARQFVNDAQTKAEATREVAEKTVAAMQRIKESSDAISKITGLIDDVAFQTNLLALNAGVEAARAGEAGRGFAVVASEVRALAQRSSLAAQEISALISSSQGEVTGGVELVDEAGAALAVILQTVTQAADKVNEIAENTSEQANGISEVSAAIEALDKDSQRSAAMLEETAAAGQMLRDEAGNLARAIAGFRLEPAAPAGAEPAPERAPAAQAA